EEQEEERLHTRVTAPEVMWWNWSGCWNALYGQPRRDIAAALDGLLAAREIVVETPTAWGWRSSVTGRAGWLFRSDDRAGRP
ncbi:hypothetical protein PE067_00285, partial [Paracoccus sp. DMF-8]|uniref:hypothetical protein n=1 Tax=Paracoccus sp. DMF-8 TaxID=3019445 RepID=UPI0023E88BC9